MIFSPYDNASSGDESIGLLVFAISLFPIILPSATIQPFNVGYAASTLKSGATLTAAQFANVAGSGFALVNFKPTGADVYNNVNINRLNFQGYVTETYTWSDAGGESWDTPDVWVDDANNIITDVTFIPGEAIWVNGASADQGLQSAGEVSKIDLSVQLKSGATLVGNTFPTSVSIADVYPTGNEIYNNVNINRLDFQGYVTETYTWSDAGGEGWDTPDVWVDDANNIITSVTFAPGEGFWVNAASDSQYLNIPAPEL